MNGWICLVLAGLCEIIWAVGLKYTANFSKLVPSVVVIGAMCLSVIFLNASLKTIPLSIAYAVWTGIGVLGTVIFGIWWLGEALSLIKMVSLVLIFLGIIGCKVSV